MTKHLYELYQESVHPRQGGVMETKEERDARRAKSHRVRTYQVIEYQTGKVIFEFEGTYSYPVGNSTHIQGPTGSRDGGTSIALKDGHMLREKE